MKQNVNRYSDELKLVIVETGVWSSEVNAVKSKHWSCWSTVIKYRPIE